MNKLLHLMGIQVRQRFSMAMFRYQWRNERKRFFNSLFLLLLAGLGIATLYGFYVFGIAWLIRFVKPLHATLASDMLALLLFITAVFILFSGMRSVLSQIFMAKDTAFLAMLPVQAGTVFLSKFLLVYVGQLVLTVLLVLPAALAFQWGGITADYLLRLLLVMVALPGVPLAISACFSLVLMRFSAISRYRDVLAVVGGLLLTLLIIVVQQVIIAQVPEDIDAGFLLQYLLGRGSLIAGLTRWFPPARWAAQALGTSGAWLSLGWLALLSGAALVLLYLLAQRTYYRGALTFAQGVTKKRKKGEQKPLVYAQHRPWMTMMQREWRVLLRTPVYALNSLAGMMVILIFAVLPVLQPGMRGDLDRLLTMLHEQIDSRYLLLALTAIFCFFASINPGACTVLSREGKCFWLSKLLPVPAKDQVTGKLIFGLQLSMLFSVSMLACLIFLMHGIPPALWVAFLLSLMVGWVSLALAVWMDIRAPRLKWANPTEAIKQNIHGMLGMVFVLALALVLGALSWGLIVLGAGFWTLSAVLFALLLALVCVSTILLLGASEKAYQRLEA